MDIAKQHKSIYPHSHYIWDSPTEGQINNKTVDAKIFR